MVDEEQLDCIICHNGTFALMRQIEENNICTITKVYGRCTKCGRYNLISVDTKIVDEIDDTD
jgi:hypothetical protein